MALALLNNEVAQDTVDVENVAVSGQLADAVRRMIGYCQRGHLDASFIAKGLVIDTLEDIGAQMREFFPDYTGVRHMVAEVEDKAKAVAQSSGQRYQHISFLYVDSPSKLPKPDDAGKQHSITVYGENMSNVGSDASVMAAAYRPPSGGGAAGGGANLLDHLRIANKIVFVLMFTVLDADDVRILDLISQPEVAAAFAGSPEVLSALRDAMLAGGDVGALAQSVLQNIVAVQALQLASLKSGADIQNIATAMAHKVTALMADMPTISAKLPAVVGAFVKARVDAVKVDLAAGHSARVVAKLAIGFSNGTLPSDTLVLSKVMHAVQGVMKASAVAGVSIAAAVGTVLNGNATPTVKAAVSALGEILGQTPTLPAIEAHMPEMRQALTASAVQNHAAERVDAGAVIDKLQTLMAANPNPLVQDSLVKLQDSQVMPGFIQPIQVQAVVENLQAIAQTQSLPPAVAAELAVITPQLEALSTQLRTPDLGRVANDVVPAQVAQAFDSLRTLSSSSNDATLVASVQAIEKTTGSNRAEILNAVIQNLEAVQYRDNMSPDFKKNVAKVLEELKTAETKLGERSPQRVDKDSVISLITERKVEYVSPKSDKNPIITTDRNPKPTEKGCPIGCKVCFADACAARAVKNALPAVAPEIKKHTSLTPIN